MFEAATQRRVEVPAAAAAPKSTWRHFISERAARRISCTDAIGCRSGYRGQVDCCVVVMGVVSTSEVGWERRRRAPGRQTGAMRYLGDWSAVGTAAMGQGQTRRFAAPQRLSGAGVAENE